MRLLKCSEAEGLIVQDLDEGLDPVDKDRLESHIGLCENCALVREDMKLIFSTASSDVPQVPDEEFWGHYKSSLNARILEKELAGKPWRRKLAFPILAAAAAVIIAIVGFRIDYQPSEERTVSSSDIVIDDLEQVFGPSRSELGPTYDGGMTTVLNGLTDDAVVRWFEIEDEPNQNVL